MFLWCFVSLIFFFFFFRRRLLHSSGRVCYTNIELMINWMKYECGYKMQNVECWSDVSELILQFPWQINKREQMGKEKMIMDFLHSLIPSCVCKREVKPVPHWNYFLYFFSVLLPQQRCVGMLTSTGTYFGGHAADTSTSIFRACAFIDGIKTQVVVFLKHFFMCVEPE